MVGLFSHDKLSARASGKYTDNGELPALPGQAPVYPQTPQNFLQSPPQASQAPQGTPYDVSGIASQPFDQVIGLPKAPPPRRGAFDNHHYQQTMLQMAAGFFGAQNFGDGMANAATAIAQGNEAVRQAGRPTLGGPDDAFEIYTDPETGEHRYVPIKEAQDYLEGKRNRITPKDRVDFNSRYAMQLAGIKDPEQRELAAQYMATNPALFPAFDRVLIDGPEIVTGVVARNGQTVPQQVAAKQRSAAEEHREADRAYRRQQGDQRIAIQGQRASAATRQGDARVGIARANSGLAREKFNVANPAQVSNEAQYRALPRGTPYIAPDGSHRIKN
jgi:hypothetical protein